MAEAILQYREKAIFWSFVGALFLLAGFYVYFVNSTIHNVVARQTLERKASALSLSIGSEEFKYISMRNAVTLPLAYSLGFKDVASKTFISANTLNQVSYLSH